LLKANTFNGLSGIDWLIEFELLGENAFAPGALQQLTTWLVTKSK